MADKLHVQKNEKRMTIFDPILLILLGLTAASLFLALPTARRPIFWLVLLTILLFGLPRAGGVVKAINLPLPISSLLAAGITLQWFFLRRGLGHPQRMVDLLVLAYAMISGLGLALGLGTGGNYLIAGVEICLYLFSIGLFFYARDNFVQPRDFRVFIKLLLALSVMISLYGIAQYFFGGGLLINYVSYNSATDLARTYVDHDNRVRRVLSSYGDPNVLAAQLMVFIGMAGALLFGSGHNLRIRLLAGLILAANLLCTVLTGSRAGLFGLIIIGLTLAIWRSRWCLLLLGVALIAGIYFLPGMLATEISQETNNLIAADDIRHQFPTLAVQLIQAAPLGCGFGNTLQPQFSGNTWTFEVTPAVNIWHGFNSFWLNLLSRLGVLGVLAFLAIITLTFREVWRQNRQVQDPKVRSVIIGALAGFLAQWAIWLVNNTYMLPGGNLNFWFTLGMLVAGVRAYSAQAFPVLVSLPGQPPVGIRTVASGLGLGPACR